MSRSDTLLCRTFSIRNKDGKRIACGGQVDTDEGTPSLWAYLETEGYVVKATKSGRGILGHRFARKTTPKGEARVAELLEETK